MAAIALVAASAVGVAVASHGPSQSTRTIDGGTASSGHPAIGNMRAMDNTDCHMKPGGPAIC